MDRKKIIYIGIILIITVMVSVTYFSYAFLAHNDEYNGRLNVVVGTLDYKLSSSLLDSNNSITLLVNEKARLNIEIESLNEIDSKYELYYQTDNNGIEIGYNTNNQLPTGTINSKTKKIVTVIIKNATSDSATITFGVQGGFTYNTLVLETGKTSIGEFQSSYCEVAANTVYNYTYTGKTQEFNVPCSGNYKMELWGAQGGSNRAADSPGLGGYVSGNIDLESNSRFYVQVGNQGSTAIAGAATPSYNGGGTTGYYSNLYEGFGGGATDIRTVSGSWNNADSLRSRIIVAAGGGGGGGSYSSYYLNGGHAGGLTGTSGTCTGASNNTCSYSPVTGGTQTAGGYNNQNSLSGSFGVSSLTTTSTGYSGGGGSGWYAGVKGFGTGGSGGSSYISGHTGCVAVASTTSSSPKSGCTGGTTDNSCSISPYGYKFTNTKMIDGAGYNWTNQKKSLEQMPNPSGGKYASGKGHTGNGYARITYLSESTKEEKTKIGNIVTYNTNGGTLSNTTQLIPIGTNIGTLPIPTSNRDYFEGWYLESTFTTKVDSSYIPTSDITLYARYGTEVSLNLTGRTSGTPSDTTSTNTTKRTFNTNTYVNGMAANNYYAMTYFTSSSRGASTVTVASGCGYGMSIPMSLENNKTYVITSEPVVNGMHYASDGTFLGSISTLGKSVEGGYWFTVLSNAKYTLFQFSGNGECSAAGAKTSRTYTNIHLYKLD